MLHQVPDIQARWNLLRFPVDDNGDQRILVLV